MNKTELVEAVAKGTKLTKVETEGFINGFLDVVKSELKKGGDVVLTGFGSFKVVKKAARTGRNPKTGAELKIPARKSPKFTAGKGLKEAVNNK